MSSSDENPDDTSRNSSSSSSLESKQSSNPSSLNSESSESMEYEVPFFVRELQAVDSAAARSWVPPPVTPERRPLVSDLSAPRSITGQLDRQHLCAICHRPMFKGHGSFCDKKKDKCKGWDNCPSKSPKCKLSFPRFAKCKFMKMNES